MDADSGEKLAQGRPAPVMGHVEPAIRVNGKICLGLNGPKDSLVLVWLLMAS